jgi:RNA-directed DNA polymerase
LRFFCPAGGASTRKLPAAGKTRPLGIPAVEDKLLQIAVSRILNAILEPIFLPCSWAYRLGRNAREAVRTLKQELQFGCYGYVVEIDIKGFFDRIDHNGLLKMLELRIDDRPLLRLIWKWLKAGVLEEGGKVIHPDTGCPQGSGISPVLANIYLHYVLDLWFTDVVKPRCKARAFMCRFADDGAPRRRGKEAVMAA